jgi:acyl-CoA thioester hydrolase
VIYGDTDRMGVVYYANYLRFFEAGRTELLRAAGIDYRKMEAEGALLPVAEAHAKYRAPAGYDDELELETIVSHVGTSSIRIRYELRRVSDEVLVATGETKHACVNVDGRVIRMPEFVRQRLEAEWS